MREPTISLIICTRNRADQLARTLGAVQSIERTPPWELVIVDNGSSDATAAVLAEFGRSYDGILHLERQPRRGLTRARNAGLSRASAPLVAFTDDDCYPAPDFLARVRDCFAEDATLGFLGGRILLHDPTDHPITVQPSTVRRAFPAGTFVAAGLVQGANMAFRRRALDDVSHFDTRLGPGTRFNCEDIDVVARVGAAGWPGAYDPRPTVRHHHGRKHGADVSALARSYDHGRGAYYAKCLSNPRLRAACGRHWASELSTSPRRALREVGGALHYWADALVHDTRDTDHPR